jgi:hypothetical protein
LFALASGEHVEALGGAGKSHRGLDVALGKMKANSAGDRDWNIPGYAGGGDDTADREHEIAEDDLARRGGDARDFGGVNILVPDRRLETGDIFRVNGYDRAMLDLGAGVHRPQRHRLSFGTDD